MAVIELSGLTRTYRLGDVEVHALRGIDLVVERGEFVAIMGASGSGKSTLMHILGCLDRPNSGRYLLDGVDTAGLSEPQLAELRSERLGFVFQTFNLLARTSAAENVALPLFYSGTASRRERLARAREALACVGLAGWEKNTPAQMSGGQQQRVAMARALINSPQVLLADEPAGNLDTKTSHEIMDALAALNREQGVTLIVVTHEPDIAAYADRAVTIQDGRVLSDTRNAAARTAAAEPAPRLAGERRSGASLGFVLMVLSTAAQAIGRNAMRSVLTMLGVFIGVAALIAMVAVGQGANEAVQRQIQSLGTNLLVVLPGATTSGGARAGSGSASTLTVSDAQAIRREATAVGQVSYLIRQSGQIQYGNQNWTTGIQGVSSNYPPITNWRIGSGRMISEQDDAEGALVVLIGQTVARQLFDAGNPVGATVIVKATPMRVIGVLAPKGQTPFGQDQDDLVMVPFTTAQRKVLGVAAPSQQTPVNWIYVPPANPYGVQPRLTGFVNQIFVQAASPDRIQAAIDEVTEILRRRHRIRPGEAADFSVRNLSQPSHPSRSSWAASAS